MRHLYGPQLYKCPRIYCMFFHEGFANLAQRNSHVERHDRSHLCKITGCLYATLGYPKADDLARHKKAAHPEIITEEDFTTLLDIDTQLDDQASENSSVGNSEEHRGFTEHPDGFQCTLCPARFTQSHDLASHRVTHTEKRPFVCTVCHRAFAKQHTCRRHEALHDGEKKFVCRGTLQNNSLWGCGRRFARADTLGGHFRSGAGRVCIKPLLDEEVAERQKASLEEQQQAQVAAGLVAPQPLLAQPHMEMMDNFLPAAIL
jgi:hypothetical protein